MSFPPCGLLLMKRIQRLRTQVLFSEPFLRLRARRRIAFATRLICLLAGCCFLVAPAKAGLYYSGETYAELPSQWRGFLLDQRALRNLAVRGTPLSPESTSRTGYLEEATKLQKKKVLTAD